MTNDEQFKSDIISLLKNSNTNIDDFYKEIVSFSSGSFFSIEETEISNRTIDLGPNKPFQLKFKGAESVQKIVTLFEEIIELSLIDESVNRLRLLVLASIIEEHTHGKPIQEKIYQKLQIKDIKNIFQLIINFVNSIDWKSNFDINNNPSSINDWNNLIRSLAHLFHHSNLIEILVLGIRKAKEANIKIRTPLMSLLKARILFSISLDDYLSVFKEDNFEFIVGFLFCNYAPHYPSEEKAVEFVNSKIKKYSKDDKNFELLISKIFTDYYYQNDEKNEVRANIVKIISQELSKKIKNKKYSPKLNLRDYVIYPRVVEIFSKLQTNLSDRDISDHVVKMLNVTLTEKYFFMDLGDDFKLPNSPFSKITQESYVQILHSILNCSDDVYKCFEKKIRQCCYQVLPHFFGRFCSEQFAIKFTTNLYLIMLSVIWWTDDIVLNKNRFESILEILNVTLLESYTYKLVPSLKNDYNSEFYDDVGSFMKMMEHAAKLDKLDVYSVISNPIQNYVPLNWPWLRVGIDKPSTKSFKK